MCNFENIKIVEGNAFSVLIPLKKRTYISNVPIDEDVDILSLTDIVVKIGGVEYAATKQADGVLVNCPATLEKGSYDIVLTAQYVGNEIRAAYFEALTIVAYNYQSNAEQYIQGAPIELQPAFVIYNLSDAELEQLKQQYREAIAAAEAAEEAAEEAKREWEQKAAELDGVAQESTLTQGVQDIRGDISHISIDTSTLAKQGTNPNATLSDVQTAAQAAETTAQGTANKNEILAAIAANAGVPTLTIPDSTASQELAPNTLYVFATRTSTLTLTLGTPIVGIANEYHFFVVCGATAPTINFPSGITWNGGSAPTIAADKTYEVSILNNVAAYFEV